tara:strand:- start:327 stop:557 length:231 start_codon:yes stop_codon:yes gene_type:complete
MPKRVTKSRPRKAQTNLPRQVNRQLQFVAIHNTALKNLSRDDTHAQRIAEKIKEQGEDLSDARLEDLMRKRKELLE